MTYQSQVGYPLLYQVQQGHDLNGSLVAHASFDKLGGGDLIINNLDAGISHPFHLHGKPFFIVGRGEGKLTAEEWQAKSGGALTKNPLRRDVIEIPGANWAVLRRSSSSTEVLGEADETGIMIDLPGVWPLHCHIGWHLSEGKLAAIVYQPEAIKSIAQPDDWKAVSRASSTQCVSDDDSFALPMDTTRSVLPNERAPPSKRTWRKASTMILDQDKVFCDDEGREINDLPPLHFKWPTCLLNGQDGPYSRTKWLGDLPLSSLRLDRRNTYATDIPYDASTCFDEYIDSVKIDYG